MTIFPTNHVLLGRSTFKDRNFKLPVGATRGAPSVYESIGNLDLTENTILRPQIISADLERYLNRFFPGWRLLRRVTEYTKLATDRSQSRRWKILHYIIVVQTDADAETLASRLRKNEYKMPFETETYS